jgi:RNA polymerase sigma-70 factor (ECF subfamily)
VTDVDRVGVEDLAVEDGSGVEERGASRVGFDAFFAAEYQAVVGLASVLCGRAAVAEELAQEAFLAAFQRWERISSYEDPGGWVRRVVANLATSSWRRRVREARALRRLWTRRQPVVEVAGGDPQFWAAVRALPARQAQCVALYYLEDRSVAQIAGVLGVAEPTVRVHLHAGRKELAFRLGESHEEGIE